MLNSVYIHDLFRINRRVTRDVTVKGVYIKKGLMIQIPIFAIHRDPKKWPDPNTFDPNRWVQSVFLFSLHICLCCWVAALPLLSLSS